MSIQVLEWEHDDKFKNLEKVIKNFTDSVKG